MKKNSLKILAFCAPFALASCSGSGIDLGGAPNLSTDDGVKEVMEIVKNNFGDKDVFDISISAEDHLDDNLGYMYVKYVDGDKTISQSYTETSGIGLSDPKEETSFPFKAKQNSLKKGSEIDFSFIPAKFEEAKKIITELTDEYEGFVLYGFDIEINEDGKYEGELTLEGTKKGEGTSVQGRNIVTNYYEFDFDLNADGTIELDE